MSTSGATESNNLAILGLREAGKEKNRRHIITSEIEHKAILDVCKYLETKGFEVTYLPVNTNGIIDINVLKKSIRKETILISIMAVNNEVGVIQPISEIGHIAKENGIIFHTDAAQAVGKIPINVEEMGIDLMSISAHKMYGPKGVGALYVRRKNPRVRLAIQMHGGGHERGMRSGTLNVPGIVGMTKALEICITEMNDENKRILYLRNKLWDNLKNGLEEIYVNGDLENRIAGNLNVSFAFVEGESLMMGIKHICVSSGSACTSASLEPSHVLKAMKVPDELSHSSIRFGIGRFTTEEEINYTIEKTIETVNRLRSMSPLYDMFKEGVDIKSVKWESH